MWRHTIKKTFILYTLWWKKKVSAFMRSVCDIQKQTKKMCISEIVNDTDYNQEEEENKKTNKEKNMKFKWILT